MRIWHAAALAALFAASGAAPARVRATHGTGPFLPLSVADADRNQSGCTCTFIVRRGGRTENLLQLSGHVLLSQSRAGLNLCPISEAQFQALSGPVGSAHCAGRHITIRSGPSRDLGNDSAAADATVSVTENGRTRLLHGTWACAC